MRFALVVMVMSSLGVYRASTFRPYFNFHTVDEGRFYRSAQPRPEELRELVQSYGIRTVINLRGAQTDEKWYQKESATLKELGVKFESVAFSSEDVQSPEEWRKYLAILARAPRPILVHCRSGADRTGEASAIYALEYMHQTRQQALEQLTPEYLHFEIFKPAKRLFVANYQGPKWLNSGYKPCAEPFRRYAHQDCKSTP